MVLGYVVYSEACFPGPVWPLSLLPGTPRYSHDTSDEHGEGLAACMQVQVQVQV